jgi:hypothetical protein
MSATSVSRYTTRPYAHYTWCASGLAPESRELARFGVVRRRPSVAAPLHLKRRSHAPKPRRSGGAHARRLGGRRRDGDRLRPRRPHGQIAIPALPSTSTMRPARSSSPTPTVRHDHQVTTPAPGWPRRPAIVGTDGRRILFLRQPAEERGHARRVLDRPAGRQRRSAALARVPGRPARAAASTRCVASRATRPTAARSPTAGRPATGQPGTFDQIEVLRGPT